MGKDPGIAALIATIGGIFGFLGLGHIYAGAIGTGILLMISYWILVFLGILLLPFLIGIPILIVAAILWFFNIYHAYKVAKGKRR